MSHPLGTGPQSAGNPASTAHAKAAGTRWRLSWPIGLSLAILILFSGLVYALVGGMVVWLFQLFR